MSAIATVVAFGAMAALLCFALCAAAVSGWRLLLDDGRLRLAEAVRGQGAALPGPESEAAVHRAALAVRRCVGCAEHRHCDALLAARDWKSLRAICPNTDYLDSLRTG